MAKVTYGSGITEYKGSVGGLTYQKNGSGNIVKLKSNPTLNPSPLQSPYQNRLSYLVSLWPTISQYNKDLWNTFAAAHDHSTPWGDTRTISGYQWFLSTNLKRMLYHSTAIIVPPTWAIEAPPPQFVINYDTWNIWATFSPDWSPDNDVIVYCTLPLKQSSIKLRRSLYLIKVMYNSLTIPNLYLTTEIVALIGTPWNTFTNNVDCNLIIRMQQGEFDKGLFSSYTSAIKKIT